MTKEQNRYKNGSLLFQRLFLFGIIISMVTAFVPSGILEMNKRNRLIKPIFPKRKFVYSAEKGSQQMKNSRRLEVGNYDHSSTPDILQVRKKKRSNEKSNFWTFAPETVSLDENDVLPCESNLDIDGPLPFGSYRMIGNPEYESKKTCLTTIAVDLMRLNPNPFSKRFDFSDVDASKVVTNMQSMIDSGFTTFQIAPSFISPTISSKKSSSNKASIVTDTDWLEPSSQEIWSESNLYSSLLKNTPASVMSSCHLTSRINLPSENYDGTSFGRGTIVRQLVGQTISRLGDSCESIDSLQLRYHGENPYIFDILDVLFDMQREGRIRSITGMDMPPTLIENAKTYGFEIDTNQITCNLLDPNSFVNHTPTTNNNNETNQKKLLLSSPLAGGILSENFFQNKYSSPPAYSMSQSQNWHIEHSLKMSWAERHHGDASKIIKEVRKGKIWEDFYSRFYQRTLKDIATKHQVSVSSVALRWAMQIGNLGSVVVASGLNGLNDDDRTFERPRSLRQLYSFHLDEEDMQRLWDVSGKKKEEEIVNISLDDDYSGTFLPDFSNTKLWL